jgi:hypothetical protein
MGSTPLLRLNGDYLYRVALAGYSPAGSECRQGLSLAPTDQWQHGKSSTKGPLETGVTISNFV